jgi:tetratricopeptide (TPR) repeat protein
MGDIDRMLADVRALASRGNHHAIVARYGHLDDAPADDTWNSPDLLYEIGRAFGILGTRTRSSGTCSAAPTWRRAGRPSSTAPSAGTSSGKKKWTKALRWYDRALQSFPTYHLCLFRRGYCLEKLPPPARSRRGLTRARDVWEQAGTEQRDPRPGVQVQVLFHLSAFSAIWLISPRPPPRWTPAASSTRDRSAGHPPRAPAGLPGELLLRQNDHAGARPLRRGREIDPDVELHLGAARPGPRALGDFDDAESAYRRAVRFPAARSRISRSAASTSRHPQLRRARPRLSVASASSRAPSRSSRSSSRAPARLRPRRSRLRACRAGARVSP